MKQGEMDTNKPDELSAEEFLGWLELGCWTALVLAPCLWWINGPSVSTDQFVVRTGLVVVTAVGAVSLRIAKWIRTRKQS